MSRFSNLLRQVEKQDRQLAADLKREVDALSGRRAFGLNFERHIPETVELPGRPVRRGDKVRFLPQRGEKPTGADRRLWRVGRIRRIAGGKSLADLVPHQDKQASATSRPVEDLVVVAEFRDPVFPGLVSTGKVERGGDRPFHTIINAENFHALQVLLYTHEGRVDAIYIDPPYNSGARDWKYNNDYVDSEDAYRHSKWLAMMERRLKLAKRLLNPDNSVLIVTIDEKEYLRLGLLLKQVFEASRVQMVSITISPRGTNRTSEFSRVDEYAFFVFLGSVAVQATAPLDGDEQEVRWQYLRRGQKTLVRGSRPNQFYPIYVDIQSERIVKVGSPMKTDEPLASVPDVRGAVPVFPIDPDGLEKIWGLTPATLRAALEGGYVRVTPGKGPQPYTISYLTTTNIKLVEAGRERRVIGTRPDGSKIVVYSGGKPERRSTVWRDGRHDAGAHGTSILRSLLPDRSFPFPKSLYAVEDALSTFVAATPQAVVLDFFAGSGTTAHAVMRLNQQDGGQRQCVLVTNNEVSADEHERLWKQGLRPGDPRWEGLGICEHITKPRVAAAVTGKTPSGEPVEGYYMYDLPIADGFEENVEFFTLTYEAPRPVAHNRAFKAIAPLLWIRAGSQGRRIEVACDDYDVAETYGVLFDLDSSGGFLSAVRRAQTVRMAFVVTDDDRGFQAVCGELPARVEAVRLYESYLTNFTINTGQV